MKKPGMGKALLAVVLCGTMMWTACSMAWISEAEQIVAALIPGTANLVALVAALQGKSVSAARSADYPERGIAGGSGFAADAVADHAVSKGGCVGAAGVVQSDPECD